MRLGSEVPLGRGVIVAEDLVDALDQLPRDEHLISGRLARRRRGASRGRRGGHLGEDELGSGPLLPPSRSPLAPSASFTQRRRRPPSPSPCPAAACVRAWSPAPLQGPPRRTGARPCAWREGRPPCRVVAPCLCPLAWAELGTGLSIMGGGDAGWHPGPVDLAPPVLSNLGRGGWLSVGGWLMYQAAPPRFDAGGTLYLDTQTFGLVVDGQHMLITATLYAAAQVPPFLETRDG